MCRKVSFILNLQMCLLSCCAQPIRGNYCVCWRLCFQENVIYHPFISTLPSRLHMSYVQAVLEQRSAVRAGLTCGLEEEQHEECILSEWTDWSRAAVLYWGSEKEGTRHRGFLPSPLTYSVSYQVIWQTVTVTVLPCSHCACIIYCQTLQNISITSCHDKEPWDFFFFLHVLFLLISQYILVFSVKDSNSSFCAFTLQNIYLLHVLDSFGFQVNGLNMRNA